MMVCLELHLILMLQMTALVGCITEQATKSGRKKTWYSCWPHFHTL